MFWALGFEHWTLRLLGWRGATELYPALVRAGYLRAGAGLVSLSSALGLGEVPAPAWPRTQHESVRRRQIWSEPMSPAESLRRSREPRAQVACCGLEMQQRFGEQPFSLVPQGPHHVVETDLKLTAIPIRLPQPPECWDYRPAPPHPA